MYCTALPRAFATAPLCPYGHISLRAYLHGSQTLHSIFCFGVGIKSYQAIFSSALSHIYLHLCIVTKWTQSGRQNTLLCLLHHSVKIAAKQTREPRMDLGVSARSGRGIGPCAA